THELFIPLLTKMREICKFWLFFAISAIQLITAFGAYQEGGIVMETPSYIVNKTEEKYEIRTYPESTWICKEHIHPNCTLRAQIDVYMALYEYFKGKNTEGLVLSATTPFTMKTTLNYDEKGNSRYLMCKYLPKANQEIPPKPLEEGLFVEYLQEITVAARRFKAYLLKETDWEPEYRILVNDLNAAGEGQMDIENYYGVTYDPPFQVDGRHSEIWIVQSE
ncbi:hypothetical protein SK128_028046, partial [Halocaridina rubra]